MNDPEKPQTPTDPSLDSSQSESRSLDSTNTAADRDYDRFESAWRKGEKPQIKEFLADVPKSARAAVFRNLLALELDLRRRVGEEPVPEELTPDGS